MHYFKLISLLLLSAILFSKNEEKALQTHQKHQHQKGGSYAT